jgi:mRNA interferase RelE/StbE
VAYRVEIRDSARKTLRAFERDVRRQLGLAIDEIGENPRRPGVEALQGEKGLYRYRSGSYRIIFSIRDDELVVLIVDVDHRKQVYR